MWTLINATNDNVTVGDLTFKRGQRHTVFSLNKTIVEAVVNNQLYSNPPITFMLSLEDNSGGEVKEAVGEITEVGNVGSADVNPTADAIATLTAAVNDLKAVVAA